MRLTRESRYAIQALMILARHSGQMVGARQIAAEAGLPVAFLQKILRLLAVAGVIESIRGRGCALAREPASITMREVLAAIEGPDVFGGRCIFWREECAPDSPCELHFRWREVKPGLEDAIARTSLAEIIREAGGATGAARSAGPLATRGDTLRG
jgi:Rrf2 family protein